MLQKVISITFILTISYTLHHKIILNFYQDMYNTYYFVLYLDADASERAVKERYLLIASHLPFREQFRTTVILAHFVLLSTTAQVFADKPSHNLKWLDFWQCVNSIVSISTSQPGTFSALHTHTGLSVVSKQPILRITPVFLARRLSWKITKTNHSC